MSNSLVGRVWMGSWVSLGALSSALACAEGLPVSWDGATATSTQEASTAGDTMQDPSMISAGGASTGIVGSPTGNTVPTGPEAVVVGGMEEEQIVTQGIAPANVVRQDDTSSAGGPNLTIEDNTAGAASEEEEEGTTGGTFGGGTTTGSTSTGSSGATSETGFDYVQATYTYGDDVSTGTIDVSDGEVCFSGTAADAGSDFANWGVGVGLQLAPDEGAVPFDAEAEGLSGFTFTVTGNIGPGLRVGVNTTTDENAAISQQLGGGDYSTVGSKTVEFSSLYQPNWTSNTAGAPLDITDIDSLQFQVTTQQGSSASFDFCIEDLEFF